MSTLVWFFRGVWGEIRRHRGHVIDRYEFWETQRHKLAWCDSCKAVIHLPKWLEQER